MATYFVAWLIGGEVYNHLNARGIDSQSRSSNLSRRPSPQGTVGIYDLFAGDKDDFLSGDEVNDLEGEMTATITEISIPAGHVSVCNETQRKTGEKNSKRERLKDT